MNRFVFDTSALLALVHDEPGIENLPSPSEMMRGGIISSVNLTEAHGRLILEGLSEAFAWEAVITPLGEIAEYSATQARRAGSLISQTRSLGLSLGDRACLALAIELSVPVYTADRIWSQLSLGVPVHVIR